jgi:hypothetical protein
MLCSRTVVYDLNALKILIVSTPKTGNTWLRNLLAAIYDAPMREPPANVDLAALDDLGSRWVAHQHYFPFPDLVTWAQTRNVVTITLSRHPGDILVSLAHYIHNYTNHPHMDPDLRPFFADIDQAATDGRMGDSAAATYLRFLDERFFHDLNVSISWMQMQNPIYVRHEDLWLDPSATLRTLTDQIHPVSAESIERAIDRCEIDLLRAIPGNDRAFFREGRIGGWRAALPPRVAAHLRREEPYPSQIATLGYTFDPDDPLYHTPPAARTSFNPFCGADQFDNGVRVVPILVAAYLSIATEITRRWGSPRATAGSDTFYHWLTDRAAKDPAGQGVPTITNLMAYFHRQRADLQKLYPDPYGEHRIGYLLWYLRNAATEYDLDAALIEPVQQALLAWANTPSDTEIDMTAQPQITKLAAYLYAIRPDVQEAYPDPYGRDRMQFAHWFVLGARREYGLPMEFILPAILFDQPRCDAARARRLRL